MKKVTLYGLNEEVEFSKSEVESFETSNGDVYEESVITTDNRRIGFDEAICEWVQLEVVE